ncbi:hypothetical protein QFZ40_001614 [Arthrobacter pascens]|uniref:hypothetical protein n=1 Tax=Arthrobacter pascens TaxID=1677 RepID=UPI00278B4768|nr:hypothetical protein [Arthrobacter pascens]MDQ0633705.1 hypothetical protein [Arthrobacter pascens]
MSHFDSARERRDFFDRREEEAVVRALSARPTKLAFAAMRHSMLNEFVERAQRIGYPPQPLGVLRKTWFGRTTWTSTGLLGWVVDSIPYNHAVIVRDAQMPRPSYKAVVLTDGIAVIAFLRSSLDKKYQGKLELLEPRTEVPSDVWPALKGYDQHHVRHVGLDEKLFQLLESYERQVSGE